MFRPSTLLAPVYLTAAILGLIGTWYFALADLATERNYLGDLVTSRPPGGSLEVVLLSVAAVVFIVVEGRRQGLAYLWAHAAAVLVLGAPFAVPLFLFMRERRLCQQAAVISAQVLAR